MWQLIETWTGAVQASAGDLMFGLKLAVIGMSVVFLVLFGIEILVRVIAKIWGPKQEAPQAPQEKKESKP